MKLIQTLQDDLRSYGGDWGAQGFWATAVHRFGEWRYGIGPAPVRKLFSLLYKILYKIVQILTGIEYPCEAPLGRGTRIDHFGGIIVSGYASVGEHCVLRQGVTLGLKNENEPVGPRLGNRVSVGAGAKILGAVEIGDDVEIGANAVVLTSVPANSLAVGIPARIIPKQSRQSKPGHHPEQLSANR